MNDIPAGARETLIDMARGAIERQFGMTVHHREQATGELAKWLARPGASFVTLTLYGRLRGCIGTLEAYRPLGQDVRDNAVLAAFHDRRFTPLRVAEYPGLHVEVSVLSAPEPMEVTSEADAIRQLRPGVDGVVLTEGSHRATYLPQVWDQLPDPHEFLSTLREKAGLAPDRWGPDTRLARYAVTAFEDTR
ncbi:AmmeMemoRadiSam system protein A [Propionibacterium freudenreichii]|uniref:AmmeMemoRadiSam system protein A n=1 Tax=Propionibacterium freudenreichii TaxID=1744 RepID=UPI000BC2C500|nr:AmmeMemoRadiSam system protein A [Propionibacterium freudenreichii]MDK9295683.1 AmmeMemoRadiSam system protein A [Propionibacterium freudenreichii]MDK9361074.1 AmmeMemoRadiSam system protein A [Propionibacterium freudenreichii]MDK9640685.1 AmmeMemoRadiSam system protein A [Propionibacterium freudenreichii]WGU90386.1 AmmeMemoRadiSam system protein A [Propionibacterium freudenreichii]SCQ59136.1 AMMECR1 domain protein [Propionibacterium freudenreichii]